MPQYSIKHRIMIKQACFMFLLLSFTMQGVFSQKTRKIQFDSKTMQMDSKLAKNAKKLLGNVIFRHEGAIMYCDSAYFYSERNALDGFSNVHIIKGDSLHLYCDFVNYNGKNKMARARKNVKLIDKQTILITDSLDFDLNKNMGHYTCGGVINNGENTLFSIIGYYYSNDDMFLFRDSVIINNPDYDIYSDTIKYYTDTKIAHFYGPTDIISNTNKIYCENGWYDTDQDISQFNKNAYLKNDETKVSGDSLYYDRNTGYGKAINNVVIFDSVENIILKGNHGIYYEKTENALLTDSAHSIQVSGELDSLYLHADTLRSVNDTSGNKLLRAYHHVKIFRHNLQGKCDSLSYAFSDSTIRLYYEPVIWTEDNQLTAEKMEIHTKNNNVDYIEMYKNCFIASQEDTLHYNQIKGNNMTVFFRFNEVYKVNVNGSGETIYYTKEKNGNKEEITGVNKSVCSDMVIYIENKDVKKINMLKNPKATLYPLEKINRDELILKGFEWFEHQRPKKIHDIFVWE